MIVVNLVAGSVMVVSGPGPTDAEGRELAARGRSNDAGYIESGGWTGDRGHGGGGDGDSGKALLLLIIVVIAGGLAILTIWLAARMSARRVGVKLSIGSAYLGRPPSAQGRGDIRGSPGGIRDDSDRTLRVRFS